MGNEEAESTPPALLILTHMSCFIEISGAAHASIVKMEGGLKLYEILFSKHLLSSGFPDLEQLPNAFSF